MKADRKRLLIGGAVVLAGIAAFFLLRKPAVPTVGPAQTVTFQRR